MNTETIQANIETVRAAIRANHGNRKSEWLSAATEILKFLLRDLAAAKSR